MVKEFVHPRLGEEVEALAGYYVPIEEQIMPYKGREVLCIVGLVCVDASCCGTTNTEYVQVPGFLVRKHLRRANRLVSEIEAITEEEDRVAIAQSLRSQHPNAQLVEVW